MRLMAIVRGDGSDYGVVAMITDTLAFNRFTVISVAAAASARCCTHESVQLREATFAAVAAGCAIP